MKKTYVTKMPNHIGAFLQATRCFAKLEINLTRVSYNKAVDSHTLFIEAEGSEAQLKEADKMLEEIGYLPKEEEGPTVVLVSFLLSDVPGTVTEILELIEFYRFNISYMSSQANGSGYQSYKMGLMVDDMSRFSAFMKDAEEICPTRLLENESAGRALDNSIFYDTFINGICDFAELDDKERAQLLINSNLTMQTLDERGLLPQRTFDSIFQFAKLIYECKGDKFVPRISRHNVGEKTEITVIEPDCGSNTIILKYEDELLFVDCGYACYETEMQKLFKELVPNFEHMEKQILVSHADIDHCGLLDLFDRIILSKRSAECLNLQYMGEADYREKNPMHKPYIDTCKLLTKYHPVGPDKMIVPWYKQNNGEEPVVKIGRYSFGECDFDVYEGKGGHLPGEIVLIDKEHHLVFTGDIYINIKEMTKKQREYNQYAPILMTSVDTDPGLCRLERNAVFDMLDGEEEWLVFGAHGPALRWKK